MRDESISKIYPPLSEDADIPEWWVQCAVGENIERLQPPAQRWGDRGFWEAVRWVDRQTVGDLDIVIRLMTPEEIAAQVRKETMERCCRAMCVQCDFGDPINCDIRGTFWHTRVISAESSVDEKCEANAIRRAFDLEYI